MITNRGINRRLEMAAGLLLCLHAAGATAEGLPEAGRHPLAGASVTGAPGESGLMYLLDDAWYVNPLNNDIAGRTDKFLTHSSRFGWTRRWGNESIDVRSGWRFITPSYDIIDGVQIRPPVGTYGDWAEVQVAYAVLFDDSPLPGSSFYPRVQIEAGIGHLGPKGAREIQVGLHKQIRNSWEHLTWVDQKRGVTSSAGAEVGLASEARLVGAWQIAAYTGWGISSSPVIFQHALKAAVVARLANNFGFSMEARHVRQLASMVLRDLQLSRQEVSAGLLLSRWYKPTVTWVGPYYHGDADGQLFVDVVNFNWPM